jgi:hypothetical protein
MAESSTNHEGGKAIFDVVGCGMSRLSKLISIRPGELQFRLMRELRMIQERIGIKNDGKNHHPIAPMGDIPLLGFEKDEVSFKKHFRMTFSDEAEKILHKAQKVLSHHFDLLGYHDLNFGRDIDWCFDPVRKKSIPLVHWSKISPLDSKNVGDLKVVWELNRHQHLIPVGQAYFLTGDESYAEEVVKQIEDWKAKNPVNKGPNWASSLEVAFRLIAWIWVLRLIRRSRFCTQEFISDIDHLVYEHARHIERYLSVYFSPNTHLTGEALGLFYAGLFFPSLPEATRWANIGKDILLKMLPIHLLQDGGYIERTLWYHLYTVNFYLHFFILQKKLNEPIPEWAWKRVEEGVEFLMYSLKPDGTIPMIGDDDGGFFLPLSSTPANDPRGTLALFSVLFEKDHFKFLAGGARPEILWFLGPDGFEDYQNLNEQAPHTLSKGFKETGYFFFRSTWDSDSRYMAFDCGPHGWLNGGHAHADLLSFNITCGPKSVIEDPGTYLYINEDNWRNVFRGPENHATLWIDNKHPAIPSGNFRWQKAPLHQLKHFYAAENHDYLAGRMFFSKKKSHLREVHFIKPYYFLIIDSIEYHGEGKVEIRFPLSTGEWGLLEIGCWQEDEEYPCGIIPLLQNCFEIGLQPSWISTVYGNKKPSNTLIMKAYAPFPLQMAYLVDLSGKKPAERPSFVLWKNVFKLSYKGDTWMGFSSQSSTEPVKETGIETDYQAGILRQCPSGNYIGLAMHEGSYFQFHGKEIKATSKAD